MKPWSDPFACSCALILVPLWWCIDATELLDDRQLSRHVAARLFVEDVSPRNRRPDLESRLLRKLQMVDDATTDQDLRVPPSNHFEKLRGQSGGWRSIRVNKQWPLIFSAGTVLGVRRRASIWTITATGDGGRERARPMLVTKRKPAAVGEILIEEFMEPLRLTQGGLVEAMGV